MEFDTKEEALEAMKGVEVDEFEGMNCNDYLDEDQDECTGWDGESRRCDCGNRRVDWLAEQTTSGKWYAYAYAY